MELKFKQIENLDDFLPIKEQWNTLVKSTQLDHAFFRHEWFSCWIKHIKPKSQLMIQTAWKGDQLVAAAPMHIIKEVRKGTPLNLLSFLVSGISPRCNFIIHPSIDEKLFFDSLFNIKGWNVIELQALEESQETTKIFLKYLKNKSKPFYIEEGLQSPYDNFETDWDAYLENRSRKFKYNYKSSLKRMNKAKSYHILSIDTYDEFEKYFDKLIEISGKSWKSKFKTDLYNVPALAKFYLEFSRIGSADKLFGMILLFINDEPVAFDYFLKNRNRKVGLRCDHDENFKYYMPGIFIHNHNIKSMFDDEDAWEFDCSGMKSDFKLEMVDKIRKHIDITVGSASLYSKFLMLCKRMLMIKSGAMPFHLSYKVK